MSISALHPAKEPILLESTLINVIVLRLWHIAYMFSVLVHTNNNSAYPALCGQDKQLLIFLNIVAYIRR